MATFKVPLFGCDKGNPLFSVKSPVLTNKFVSYGITGEDSMGVFEGQRRYNEFYLLRQNLVGRWPGVYIPAMPPKKAVVRSIFYLSIGK